MCNIFFQFKKNHQNVRGSITLEASIVMPAILLILFSLVFLSMYEYQKLVLLDSVVYTARQRAVTWDNTGKAIEDGFMPELGYDGLYWRIYNDFTGFAEKNNSGTENQGSPLVKEKTKEGGNFLYSLLQQGSFRTELTDLQVRYIKKLFERTVVVGVSENFIFPDNWLSDLFDSRLKIEAQSDVVEPVEYIRNIDLAAKYSSTMIADMIDRIGGFGTEQKGEVQSRQLIASSAKRYGKDVKVYHYPGCKYISRIKESNRIEFETVQEANSNGYYMCLYCARRKAE